MKFLMNLLLMNHRRLNHVNQRRLLNRLHNLRLDYKIHYYLRRQFHPVLLNHHLNRQLFRMRYRQ